MTSLRLRSIAADLPRITELLAKLERELPEGRTRDVVEQAGMATARATKLLVTEAAVLARGTGSL